jgi:glycosyltransferase involved in cell wall biosynthesis
MARIMSINNYHYRRGGSDAVYLDHAALMESMGWKNAFFSMHHPKNLKTEWGQYFVDEVEYGHVYSVASKLLMATKIIYSFEAQKKVRQLIEKFQPDIAHTHCIHHHLSPSILPVLRQANIPIVMTAHELKVNCPAATMLNSGGICERCKGGDILNVMRYRCIKNSIAASALVAVESSVHRWMNIYRNNLSKVIMPSRFYLEKYVEWGWSRDKLVYIPNYIDTSILEPQFKPGTYFLYFGRLSTEKGIYTLVRAACEAGVQLKIAGIGPQEKELKALATQLEGDIEFLGFRSGENLHDLIRNARAVVLPSEWYENAPISLLESCALGKVIVGARIGGIPEMIEEGLNGVCFESGNVDELVEILRQLQSSSDFQIEKMGRASRELVEMRFNRKQYVEAIVSLYSSLGVRNV